MEECVFCKIVKGDIPALKIYENEWVIAINDIAPVARTHILIILKKHFPDILALGEEDAAHTLGIQKAIRDVARLAGLERDGFRVISNCGEHGGQTVRHLHYHVIGGQCLGSGLIP